jgi:NB-ARC domain
VENDMDLEEAIAVIDDLLRKKRGTPLKPAEMLVLKAAWDARDYEAVLEGTKYKLNYLQKNLAPALWTFLGKEMFGGDKVDKVTFRRYMEQDWSEIKRPMTELRTYSVKVQGRTEVLGQLPKVLNFYGREAELTDLETSIKENQCVFLLGPMGIGKSALAAKLVQKLSSDKTSDFETVVWKTVLYPCSLDDLLNDLLESVHDESSRVVKRASKPQEKVLALLENLKKRRYLLILDNASLLFDESRYLKEHKEINDFKIFFGRLVAEQHRSCLLLVSQYLFYEITYFEYSGLLVRSIRLDALDVASSKKILINRGLIDSPLLNELISAYRGNPKILNLAGERIKSIFGNNLERAVKNKTSLGLGFVLSTLDEVFLELSQGDSLELKVLSCLSQKTSISEAGLTFTELLDELNRGASVLFTDSALIKILERLENYYLIEMNKDITHGESRFNLQPLVKKYIQTDPMRYISKALEDAGTRES